MNEILVFAKVKGGRQFIGMFGDLDSLIDEVTETLAVINRRDLANDAYFLLNGEEYKLFVLQEVQLMWPTIDKFIKEKKMNQEQLANLMGVRSSSLSDLKHGRIINPSFELVCKIVDGLGITLDEFRNELEQTKTKSGEQR